MTQYAPLISALVTMLLTFILVTSKAGKTVQDIPNERSLHAQPVPRVGGVGLIAGLLSGWAIMIREVSVWVVVPLILLFAVSLLDDIQGLSVRKRMLAHVVAATILVIGSGLPAQGILLALAVLLLTVWMTNLYNFMDGADGLAGGMAFFGFTVYGIAALMHGDHSQAMLNFAIGAAALGFLYHNFPPAKVFMGDAGSIPLGFLVAAMGLLGWQSGHWPAWFPLAVFSPFIIDASVTLVKRSRRGAKITQAHREHYYQRLVRMGWSHKNVATGGFMLMLAAAVSSLWNLHTEFPLYLFLGWGALYLVLMVLVDRRWSAWVQQHGNED